MRDCLYINGKDVFLEYGAVLLEESYLELISYPPMKQINFIDWKEEDGIEADLSNPVLDTNEISIKFLFLGKQYRSGAFCESLSETSYNVFFFKQLCRTYRLRILSNPSYDLRKGCALITFQFANDFTWGPNGYEYLEPKSTVHKNDEYLLDRRFFTDYGIRILDGTLSEVFRSPEVKENLLRNISSREGVSYDDYKITYKSKDVKLKCLLRASTATELWRNYDALLFDLVRPGERILSVAGEDFSFYYKSSDVDAFSFGKMIWLQFTITIHFTSQRPTSETFLLTDQNGAYILMNDEIFIDLTKNE